MTGVESDMTFQNPVLLIAPDRRRKVMLVLFVAILLIFVIFRFLDIPLRTAAAPSGIVSFELAGSQEKSSQILASWDDHADLYAAFGLGFDFLFMLVYSTFISLGCLMTSLKHSGWFSKVGFWLGWGAFLAASMDAIENLALWKQLSGNMIPLWPILAAWCASIKFTLLLVGISYILLGWVLPKKKISDQ